MGHRHPHLVETLRAGLETLDVGNHHFPSEIRAKLAQRLAEKSKDERIAAVSNLYLEQARYIVVYS